MILTAENVIGSPVKWTPGSDPDRYMPGPGDQGAPTGTKHYPQGKDGPLFIKQADGTWKHIAGGAASLETLAKGEPLIGHGPKLG